MSPAQETILRDAVRRQRVAAMKDFVLYGHFRRGSNDYQFQIDTRAYFNRQRASVREWLTSVSEGFRKRRGSTFDVIAAPAHPRNAEFVGLVNEVLFNGRAYLLSIDVDSEHKDSFIARESNLLELYRNLETTNMRIDVHFVDDAVAHGSSLARVRDLVSSLFDRADSVGGSTAEAGGSALPRGRAERVRLFKSVILLVNRDSPSSWRSLVGDPEPWRFVDVWVPHLGEGELCDLCRQGAGLGQAEAVSSTATLSDRLRNDRLREAEAVRADLAPDKLIRCDEGYAVPATPGNEWKQLNPDPDPMHPDVVGPGFLRLVWSDRLHHAFNALNDDINRPEAVLRCLVKQLGSVFGQEDATGFESATIRTADEWLADLAAALWAIGAPPLNIRKSVQEAGMALTNGLISRLLGDAAPPLPPWRPLNGRLMSGWNPLLSRAVEIPGHGGLRRGADKRRERARMLLSALMKASAVLGSSRLLRKGTVAGAMSYARRELLNASQFISDYVYYLKLLLEPGSDRAKSMFLEELLASGLEPDGSKRSVLLTGHHFPEFVESVVSAGTDLVSWTSDVQNLARLAYFENTKVLQAVVGPIPGTKDAPNDRPASQADDYLPEFAERFMEGWDSEPAHPLRKSVHALRMCGEATTPVQIGGQGSVTYEDTLSALFEVWECALGTEADVGQGGWAALIAVARVSALTLALNKDDSNEEVEPNQIDEPAGSDESGALFARTDRMADPSARRQGTGDEYNVARTKDRRRRLVIASHGSGHGSPDETVGHLFAAALGEGAHPGLVKLFSIGPSFEPDYALVRREYGDSDYFSGHSVYFLLRVGMRRGSDRSEDHQGAQATPGTDQADPHATQVEEAYLAFEAPQGASDSAVLRAARAIAVFRGRLARRMRSDRRRGVLDPLVSAKLIERDLGNRGASQHGSTEVNEIGE
ncbi:MAG: hypothetical protein LBK95_19670, partial [Bifidobacteriaceae bacterium]|nr:hypothetical protein [Bifidobacteriaceae bacterium]